MQEKSKKQDLEWNKGNNTNTDIWPVDKSLQSDDILEKTEE